MKRQAFLFLTLLFCILISSNYYANKAILRDVIHSQQENLILGASKRIKEWLRGKIVNLEAVATFVSSLDHRTQASDIQDILIKSSKMGGFASVYVGYEDNKIISGRFWTPPDGYNTLKRPWYQKTIQEQRTIVTDPYIDAGLKEVVVSICTPLKKEEQAFGVICGILSLNDIRHEILDMELPGNGYAFLIDEEGTILLHPSPQETLKTFKYFTPSRHSLFIDYNSRLEESIFSYAKIDSANWYIIAQIKKSIVYAGLNRQLLTNIFIYFFSVVFFFLIHLFYTRGQREIKQKLYKSRILLEKFINNATRGIMMLDSESKVLFVNAQLLSDFELPSKRVDQPEEIKNLLLGYFDSSLKEVQNREIMQGKQEGDKRYFLTYVPVLGDSERIEGKIIFVKDTTAEYYKKHQEEEQKRLLIQQSKMADLGEMIGAISHQWRQPLNALSILLGNLLQLKSLGKLDEKIFHENLEKSLAQIHYLAETVDIFRDFYRFKKEPETFDIIESIHKTLFILEPHFKNSGIKIEVRSKGDKGWDCFGYLNELQQVLANLLLNAKDALADSDKNYQRKIIISLAMEQENYLIRVQDNGVGIKEDERRHLFEPFFTTKGKDGTGSGLYLSRLIARNHLKGDLGLECSGSPTIFLLKICKDITKE
ncbi:cache domain-containing protein [Wolinella succinogenes]|uniref:cache domain-containing protein n=1 Tax=Wolinella succinogenes TaxID=844 RepID=UPI002FCBEE7D